MATYTWNGTSTSWNDSTNWLPSDRVPEAGDDVIFDGTTAQDCTCDMAIDIASLDAQSSYIGTLHFGSSSYNHAVSGDMTFDMTGTVNCGNCHITCGGNFDNKDTAINGTWTDAATVWTLTLNGTAKTLTTDRRSEFGHVVIDGTITLSSSTNAWMQFYSSSDLTINTGKSFTINEVVKTSFSDITINGTLDGTGSTTTNPTSFNRGTISIGSSGSFDVDLCFIAFADITIVSGGTFRSDDCTFAQDCELNGAEFGGVLTFDQAVATAKTVTFSSDIIFSGNVTFLCDNAAEYTIDNSGNHDITFQGNTTFTETFGTLTWNKGTGTITLSGTNDQTITTPTGWTDVLEDITVSKTAGKVLLKGDIYTDSFTGVSTGSGTFDPDGNKITTTGNCDWQSGFSLGSMDNSTWSVGGNFTADGQTLSATTTWLLQVTGTAVASGTGAVAYSDASGFTEIDASSGPWTDNDNNVNWLFGPAGQVPVIDDPGAQTGTVSVPFSLQMTASENPTSWNATGLPDGLSIDNAGLISGTPTTEESPTASITATNATGTSDPMLVDFTISAAPPAYDIRGSNTYGDSDVTFNWTVNP